MGSRSLKRAWPSAALILGLVTFAEEARAQPRTPASRATAREPETVAVEPSKCADSPWASASWIELLRVELSEDGTHVRAAEAGGPSSASRILVDPDACDAASATLTFSSGDVQRTRTISLADTEAAARPRVLAIAMADLVRQGMAARVSSQPAHAAEPQTLEVRVRLEPSPPRAPASPALSIWAAAETRIFAKANAGLFGPRAGAVVPLLRWLVLDADVGASWGGAHDPLGKVNETTATAGVALLGTHATDALSFGVGPRLEAGAVWLRGEAASPSTIASSAASPMLCFALSGMASFRVEGPVHGLLAIDAGTSLYGFGARADAGGEQRHVSDLAGPFLGARLGLGWSP